ncbi:MAG: ribonuclease HII [Nitrospirae bacterium]|nr:ribonuclease HII [Nitrospirota bacterium]MBI3593497.1 ribonuclease HII [Nitrospirota bacterium]
MWEKLTHFEKGCEASGFRLVAGIDEAGRGPLAGPVVAATVIFPPGFKLPGLNDSKQLSPSQREFYYQEIVNHALAIGVGVVESGVIDQINILQATLLAAKMAVSQLTPQPDYLLIDALNLSFISIPQKSIIKGDTLSYSIAGASVVAKVTRDRIMRMYHHQHPEYQFDHHKGYGTKEHLHRIQIHGPSPLHRLSFRGVLPAR